MKNLIVLLTLCFWTTSCRFQGLDQSFEMTVTVLDMDGKPVKGRTVSVSKSNSSFSGSIRFLRNTGATAITDVNGQAVLKYDLQLSDSNQDFAVITAQEDDLFKNINVVTHTLSSQTTKLIKQTGIIRMDSLVPFKIRFKTNREDVKYLHLTVKSDVSYSSPRDFTLIERDFFMVTPISTTTPKIDTIISPLVYSKADFWLRNGMTFINPPDYYSKGHIMITRSVKRDTVFLQEF